MTHELLGQLSIRRLAFKENTISVEQMGNLIDLVQSGEITGMSELLEQPQALSCPFHESDRR